MRSYLNYLLFGFFCLFAPLILTEASGAASVYEQMDAAPPSRFEHDKSVIGYGYSNEEAFADAMEKMNKSLPHDGSLGIVRIISTTYDTTKLGPMGRSETNPVPRSKDYSCRLHYRYIIDKKNESWSAGRRKSSPPAIIVEKKQQSLAQAHADLADDLARQERILLADIAKQRQQRQAREEFDKKPSLQSESGPGQTSTGSGHYAVYWSDKYVNAYNHQMKGVSSKRINNRGPIKRYGTRAEAESYLRSSYQELCRSDNGGYFRKKAGIRSMNDLGYIKEE